MRHDPPVVRRRFGFHNLRNSMTPRALAAAHADAALARLDIYGTSENNHRDASAQAGPGYVTIQGRRGFRANCAIHYKPTVLEERSWGNPLLHISNLFPSAKRAFVWARFRDKTTGRRLTFVVVHLVPHADDPHDPGDLTELPRRGLVITALHILAVFARTVIGPLVVVGDFNTDLAADLRNHDPDAVVETFRRAGLQPVPVLLGEQPFPTHGRWNVYDQAYIKWPGRHRRRSLQPRRMWRLARKGSDHYGIAFEATSRLRRHLLTLKETP